MTYSHRCATIWCVILLRHQLRDQDETFEFDKSVAKGRKNTTYVINRYIDRRIDRLTKQTPKI